MKNKYLMGMTTHGELAFAEFEVTHRNGYPEFTASFHTDEPINATRFDCNNYAWVSIDGEDKEYLFNLCEQLDCSPNDLVRELAEEMENDIYKLQDHLDCSSYGEVVEIEGDEWIFASRCGGQHDLREEGMVYYVDKEIFDRINEMWDKYHLKEVGDEVIKEVESLVYKLDALENNEFDYIRDFVSEYHLGIHLDMSKYLPQISLKEFLLNAETNVDVPVIANGAEIECDLVWDGSDTELSTYALEKYADVLVSEVKLHYEDGDLAYIEIDNDKISDNQIESFITDTAGYCSSDEHEMCFVDRNEKNSLADKLVNAEKTAKNANESIGKSEKNQSKER